MGLLVKKDKDSCSQMACGYSLTVLCNKMGGYSIDRPSQREEITWWVIRNKVEEKVKGQRGLVEKSRRGERKCSSPMVGCQDASVLLKLPKTLKIWKIVDFRSTKQVFGLQDMTKAEWDLETISSRE